MLLLWEWRAPSSVSDTLSALSATESLLALGNGGALVLDGLLGAAAAHAVRTAALFLDEEGQLSPATVGAQRRCLPSVRGDRMMWLDPDEVELSLFNVIELMEASRELLNAHAFLGAGRVDVQLSIYEAGMGYAKHRDNVRGQHRRRLTAIYYTNDWRPGDGGELALYDDAGACVRLIEPIFDRLVLFLARVPHAVLPVVRGPRVALTAFMRT